MSTYTWLANIQQFRSLLFLHSEPAQLLGISGDFQPCVAHSFSWEQILTSWIFLVHDVLHHRLDGHHRPPKSSDVADVRWSRVKGVESHLGTATKWVTSLLTTFIPTQNKLKSSTVGIEHLILKNSMFDVVHSLKLNKNLQKTYKYHTYIHAGWSTCGNGWKGGYSKLAIINQHQRVTASVCWYQCYMIETWCSTWVQGFAASSGGKRPWWPISPSKWMDQFAFTLQVPC